MLEYNGKLLRDLPETERDLAEYMREISEQCYFAGWMANLEFVLWDATKKGKNNGTTCQAN